MAWGFEISSFQSPPFENFFLDLKKMSSLHKWLQATGKDGRWRLQHNSLHLEPLLTETPFACQQCTLNSREKLLYSLCFRQDLHLSPKARASCNHKSCFLLTRPNPLAPCTLFPSNLLGLGSRGSWKEAAMGSFSSVCPNPEALGKSCLSLDSWPLQRLESVLVHSPTPAMWIVLWIGNRRYPGGLVGRGLPSTGQTDSP